MGQFLLVTLHEDLAAQGTTKYVAMLGIQHTPGVLDVVDLRAITPRTLVSFLMTDKEFAAGIGADTSADRVIRAYWGMRQSRLPEMD